MMTPPMPLYIDDIINIIVDIGILSTKDDRWSTVGDQQNREIRAALSVVRALFLSFKFKFAREYFLSAKMVIYPLPLFFGGFV